MTLVYSCVLLKLLLLMLLQATEAGGQAMSLLQHALIRTCYAQ